MKDNYPEITVRWADHWIEYGDQTMEFIEKSIKPVYGTYKGHLVAENKQMLVICANLWEMGDEDEANFSDPMFIMKRCITYRSDK